MKSVVLCGSRRFKEEMRAFAEELRDEGATVYEPYLHSGENEWTHLDDDFKRFTALGLTHDHFYKIRMADIVFVYNKDGYSGVSTTLEIGYAVALGKPIYALSDKDGELSRNVLLRGFYGTPKEISKILS